MKTQKQTALILPIVLLAFGLTGCLDESPESPRPVIDAGQFIDAATPDEPADCPSRPANAEPSDEDCSYLFVYRPDGATTPSDVRVAGDFECTPWQGQAAMDGPNESGEWSLELRLKPGAYQYKFVVDGQWIRDFENPNTQNDGQGGENSALVHACPFEPECTFKNDCTDPSAPICRHYECVACDCEMGFECDEITGRCVETPCQENAECEGGAVCAQGVCRACLETAECDQGNVCLSGQCIAPDCLSDDECDPFEESCVEYQCSERACETQLFTYDPAGQAVSLVEIAGSFTDWDESPIVMTRHSSGRWFARVPMENGSYQYKFIIYTEGADPLWISDPSATESAPDGFGGSNSLRVVDCSTTGQRFGRCGDPDVFDWRDAVMYFVMVDRFFDSDGAVVPVPGATGGDARRGPSGQYEGGDLAGVTAKLDYLNDLGVTALWLSAPYDNRDDAGAAIDPGADPNFYSGYHGYWPAPEAIDFSDPAAPSPRPRVESRIGTEEDLRELVDSAHADGMKVLFDYVMNHVDVNSGLYQQHPEWFAQGDGRDGRPADGFALCGPLNLWDDPYWGTRCAFTDYLPPFDFDNAEARAWSVADAIWWAKEFGIDGYRLDAIKHVADAWLTDLRDALDEAFPEPDGGRFYLVGETFAYDNIDLLRRYVDPVEKLDGQFDFPMKARLCEGVFQGRMNDFQGWMDSTNRDAYGPGSIMTTWIGNHDIPRAIHFASGEIGNCREGSVPAGGGINAGWTGVPEQPGDARAYELLGVAFGVLMTTPGIPLIYYGDEVGLAGGGDPDNRRMMPWDDESLAPAQLALRERIRAFAQVRKAHKALSRGRRTTLASDSDRWLFRMSCDNEAHPDVTVAINRGDQPASLSELPAGDYINVETGAPVDTSTAEVPARGILMLKAQ